MAKNENPSNLKQKECNKDNVKIGGWCWFIYCRRSTSWIL